jgi:hypothetical protein
MISDRKPNTLAVARPGAKDQVNWTSVCVQLQTDKLIQLDARAAEAGVSRRSLIQLAVYRLLEQGRNRQVSDLLILGLKDKTNRERVNRR